MPFSNHTEPYSNQLKSHISHYIQIPNENIYINAGSTLKHLLNLLMEEEPQQRNQRQL
jgi:DeoR/GlpR family transcriptional regulator of sugar metabolism